MVLESFISNDIDGAEMESFRNPRSYINLSFPVLDGITTLRWVPVRVVVCGFVGAHTVRIIASRAGANQRLTQGDARGWPTSSSILYS